MSHRKGLPPTHRYRSKKAWFDGHAEHGRKSRILSGHDISNNLKHFVNNFGNFREGRTKRKRTVSVEEDCDIEDVSSESEAEEEDEVDEEELSRWKKRSIFFQLPYWEELPVRHNLDVMHIERNVAKSIVSTLLHCGNSKDGLNTRKDLEHLGIRKDLHPRAKGKRTYLPAAPWSLSKSEKKVFCKRLSDFKGPDGYCSNISRGVSVEECKVSGLKSHDYHVLMQQLLPVAVRGLLPKGPRLAILRMCAFFNRLCQRVIDVEQISKMEAEVVETLCMFERFFPPSFFDIMVHLFILEGKLNYVVQHMKILKDYVRNTARPEGCIAESYLAEECMQFCNAFLKKTTNVEEKLDRNADYESQTILEGRPISAPKSINLSGMEKKTAHLAACIYNFYKTQMQDVDVMQHICGIKVDSETHGETLKWLAYGPCSTARSYTGYIVNGQRFHTHSVQRMSQNSGVFYEATAMCRASAKDTSQVVDLVSYYGRVTEIILLDYNVFYVPLFRCQWAVRGNGVKVEDGYTLVNLNQSQVSFNRDPYILASQAKQVFNSREDDTSCWYVVLRGPSRRYNETEEEDVNIDIGPLPSIIDMVVEIDEAHNARVDCEGIYV
ncbi:uncharacterized protein LOC106399125 [Brassica napus]|uniref:uncharacterized protein LOC106399125 n=1 Tax=Brassica napus TaxID=3708 RepID=UPI00207ADC40|nr:uncharacterized protein LOC106399125 [Brassica napus]